MALKDVIIIGVALAMDAVGVSISLGLSNKVKKFNKIAYIMSFAIFQFLLFLLGGIGGHLFEKYITSIPNLAGGIAIALVGLMMIKDGFDDNKREESILLKPIMIFILGVSVSIDAFVVGFTAFSYITIIKTILVSSIVVGAITLILSTFAFYICRYIRRVNFISRYADFFGGITLIIFSIKIIFF